MASALSRGSKLPRKDLDELLSFYDVPLKQRVKVQTTNAIERAFREVRRRTRPMSCFTNAGSVDCTLQRRMELSGI